MQSRRSFGLFARTLTQVKTLGYWAASGLCFYSWCPAKLDVSFCHNHVSWLQWLWSQNNLGHCHCKCFCSSLFTSRRKFTWNLWSSLPTAFCSVLIIYYLLDSVVGSFRKTKIEKISEQIENKFMLKKSLRSWKTISHLFFKT